jgi:hypothetical protein
MMVDGWSDSISGSMSVSDWSCVGCKSGDWCGMDLGYDGGGMNFSDHWSSGSPFYDSVESVDIISGVSNGSDGTIGLNKGVLSLDGISVSGFVSVLGVSGQTVRDRISVVVLWVGIEGLSSDSVNFGNGLSVSDWGNCFCDHWGVSISDRGSSISSISWSSDYSSLCDANEGKNSDSLEHVEAS